MNALHEEYHLSAEQRRALKILAAAGPVGCTGATLFARRFTIYMLAELVHDGLATARAETVRMGGRKVTVARLWITDAGRMAIEGRSITGTAVYRTLAPGRFHLTPRWIIDAPGPFGSQSTAQGVNHGLHHRRDQRRAR